MFDLEETPSSVPSQLYLDSLKSRPRTNNSETIRIELTARLEQLARNAGFTVEEFLSRAESDSNFGEDYLEALSMARQIARLKLDR